MRILLIEPDKVLADTYMQALKQHGHDILHTYNAQEAVHIVDRRTPDVIILEMQLKRNNGVEFLYELRSYPEWVNVPVILLSAVPDLSLTPDLMAQLGIKVHLYKPQTTMQNLIRTIDRLVVTA